MAVFNLPLAGLPIEHRLVSPGQYWLLSDEQQDADQISAGILTQIPAQSKAVLICSQGKLDQLHAILPDPPAAAVAVRTYKDRFAGGTCRFARQHMTHPEGLRKVFKKHSAASVCVLRTSLAGCEFTSALWAAHERLNRWLKVHNKILLVVVDGFAKVDVPVVALAGMMQGCMFLERTSGMLDLSVFLWTNQLGLYADLHYRMEWQGSTLQHKAEMAQPQSSTAALALDQQQLVFQRQSLQGLPLLSQHWSVQNSYQEMLERARGAQAATLIFALDSNIQVRGMANDFMSLRMAGGNNLKLVIREMEPCLRHADEELLLLSGASFVIPHSTSNQHMLLFLSALRGLQWSRPLTVPDGLASNLEPQNIRGVVTPDIFYETVQSVMSRSMSEVTHQLIELEFQSNMTPNILETQLTLRRYGDIATFVDNRLYLFLFACPDSALKAALHNVFKLPVSILFSQVRKITDISGYISRSGAGENILPWFDGSHPQEKAPAVDMLRPVLLSAAGEEKQ